MKLKEFCKFQEGYVNPSQKNLSYFDGNIKWIRATDLNNTYVFNTSRTLTKEGFESAGKSAKLFRPDTICISKSGTIGRLGILKDYMCGNRAIINIDVDINKMNMKYVFYWLMINRDYIQNLSVGSVQKNLYISLLENLEIDDIPLEQQERIASILSSIDDKIELNNKVNKTLEQMAQVIFKSWFVDFEPFNDGEFEESELGMIPKGWKTCLLKDISNITMGQSPSSETYNEDKEGVAFYQGVKDFTDRFPLVSTYCREPKKVAMPGDILLSVRAPVGRINISMEKCCIGRGCAALGSEKYGNGFLYYLLSNIKWDKYESGTVFTSIKKSDIENYKVILPNIEIINKFNKIINSLDNRILNNSVQNRDLESARDILLPRLISGEIEI